MNCDYCGKEEDLPFTCNYCGGTFCSEHRLPEAHACTGDLTRRIVANPATTRSWDGSVYSGTSGRQASPYLFSPKEVRDILIAWFAMTLALSIAYSGGLAAGVTPSGAEAFPQLFAELFVVLGGAFILHELMHKFTAERYGYWAEFRMWVMGIVFALITSTLGFFFTAPGATYISGYNMSERQYGVVSLAGPATNVVIAFLFLLVGSLGTGAIASLGGLGFFLNLYWATFNMIPVMPLDGAKVWRWNKLLWAGVFFPLLIGVILVFFG